MKNIGLLTFFGVPNCGAYAQAYALRNFISSLLPDSNVVQIAYLNDKHKKLYEIGEKSASDRNKRINALFSECCSLIPFAPIKDDDELKHIFFDCIVLGSDMIWDFSIDVYGEDRFLFGLDLNANYIFSYAPSFGTCKPEWKRIPKYVIDGLSILDSISVRDSKSVQIVKNISGRDATLALDPIWLWDWNSDPRIKNNSCEPYIFVYGEDFDEEFYNSLKSYASGNSLKTIAYGNGEYDLSWCDIVLDDSDTTPFEVIGYFKNAEYVATSTFHGMMFALFFNKKIAYFKKEFVESKVKGFLVELGIYKYFDDFHDVTKMFNSNWDYSQINKAINHMKQKSIDYLIDNFKRAGLKVVYK